MSEKITAVSGENRFLLLQRLVAGLVLGTAFGLAMQWARLPLPVSIAVTFNGLFREFLDYSVPLLVLGYVTSGIAGLGHGAGKALGATLLLSAVMLAVAGFIAFGVGHAALPHLLPSGSEVQHFSAESSAAVQALFMIDIPPIMDSMSATLTAFILGAGISSTSHSGLRSAAAESML